VVSYAFRQKHGRLPSACSSLLDKFLREDVAITVDKAQ
jgi:hypothetical protein